MTLRQRIDFLKDQKHELEYILQHLVAIPFEPKWLQMGWKNHGVEKPFEGV